MNGPTQANDVSENVRPISSVPIDPPRCEAWSIFVSSDEGSVISKAPSRLSPNTTNTNAINAFTQMLDPSCTTPNGPNAAVTRRPNPVNITTIPRQNRIA